ncbi:uncharacterized protein EMH_0062310 [Eimeria mitis]|uniref:Uncharacterized protein n=1 Tax=Eimeria mitis TaxID=44415 RepID=U6JZR9_9EIME|nr:uncharacterized protein EMH_0062310 [Eimeria mitis]CDJ30909.1 hypothetical protein EMH_0062310 [Eimeria mitis]
MREYSDPCLNSPVDADVDLHLGESVTERNTFVFGWLQFDAAAFEGDVHPERSKASPGLQPHLGFSLIREERRLSTWEKYPSFWFFLLHQFLNVAIHQASQRREWVPQLNRAIGVGEDHNMTEAGALAQRLHAAADGFRLGKGHSEGLLAWLGPLLPALGHPEAPAVQQKKLGSKAAAAREQEQQQLLHQQQQELPKQRQQLQQLLKGYAAASPACIELLQLLDACNERLLQKAAEVGRAGQRGLPEGISPAAARIQQQQQQKQQLLLKGADETEEAARAAQAAALIASAIIKEEAAASCCCYIFLSSSMAHSLSSTGCNRSSSSSSGSSSGVSSWGQRWSRRQGGAAASPSAGPHPPV